MVSCGIAAAAEHSGGSPSVYRLAAAIVGRGSASAFATLVADPAGTGVWAAAGPPGLYRPPPPPPPSLSPPSVTCMCFYLAIMRQGLTVTSRL